VGWNPRDAPMPGMPYAVFSAADTPYGTRRLGPATGAARRRKGSQIGRRRAIVFHEALQQRPGVHVEAQRSGP
jgi:hypothetical protein